MTIVDAADTFRQEAQELLEQLEHTLLDLEHRPGDADLIDAAFRALHTLKGSGAMFGFDRLAAFTHHVETAFDRVRKGEVAATAELIALTLHAKDQMRRLIEAPADADEAASDTILRGLHLILASGPTSSTARDAVDGAARSQAPAPAAAAEQTFRVTFRLPKGAMATGTNPLLLIEDLHSLGTATVVARTGEVPGLEEIDPLDCHVGWEVLLTTAKPRDAIEEVFMFLLDDMELGIELAAPAAAAAVPQAPSTDVPALSDTAAVWSTLDRRSDVGASPSAPREAPRAETRAATPAETAAPGATGQAASATGPGAATGRHGAGSIRVPAERLDELMDRVGELVIAQSRLKQIAAASHDPQVKSVTEEIERLARELQDTTMGVRMMPIGSLFGRFRRLVHDLSRDLGKDIELITSGEETELDKTVIERLADPLVHLIRNAADHGLEQRDGRAAAGKPATGRVSLTARHAGAAVLISVGDDGRGLDRDRIQARAEENGLIAPGARLADEELFKIIFAPGFSTAREVTNLSGRGVGMDVVKRTIDDLRGSIDVKSTPGHGSEVTLRLPLTLAIIDGLLVRVGKGRYVIPLGAVEECVELTPEEDLRAKGRCFLNIRGDLVPYIRLREQFASRLPPDPYQKVVIVSAGGFRVGLVVDQVIGDHQTVIKSLSRLHAGIGVFSGATILGDGSVALILDVPQLVADGQASEERLKAAS
ncbi:chemotaxis protein CheA [Rhodoplanes elegans]|uniref:Chemotaxis protein CheA n=1 Tax=Rhodoplanes elegans TaxID=29408 RepID=A0A327KEV4_9BRAD|nr:chemotaxis protein CheA [Rhodoplanes elegans]MBK5957457.1 chemotaxis protein CheA [Rhodoplanes elegans]RAI35872.1 chemotaxis protein CheA [Rhodoplanes elegans]